MQLCIVIPIYNESQTIDELCRRTQSACDELEDVRWRVLFVDDGSADDSVAKLLGWRSRDERFTLLQLSRNFGHQAAITAGLAHTDDADDAVVVMDGDLQDPPELIGQMVSAWRDGGQVVRAVRTARGESGWRRVGVRLFHWLFHVMCHLPNVGDSGVFALLDRRAVATMRQLPERNRFLPGLRSWIGFDQRVVEYDRPARARGAPKQTFRRLVRYALDAFFSFSYQPLRVMIWAGLMVSAVGFLLAVVFVVRRLIGAEIAETGFTTLVTLVLFLGGVQLVAMGVLGEYIGRIYDEVKRRPLYVVRKSHGVTSSGDE